MASVRPFLSNALICKKAAVAYFLYALVCKKAARGRFFVLVIDARSDLIYTNIIWLFAMSNLKGEQMK